MAPFSRPISPKMPPSCLQDGLERPSLAPKTAQEPPNRRPRAAQELPQSRPGSDPQAPWGEDTPHSSPRLPPDFDFGPFWPRFGWILGSFWMEFLEGFWKVFNSTGSIFSQLSACSAGGLALSDAVSLLLAVFVGGHLKV